LSLSHTLDHGTRLHHKCLRLSYRRARRSQEGIIYTSDYARVDDATFGIDKAFSLYGPGNWAAWLFAVGSCCIDRGLGRERSLDAKRAHLMGLDLNLVAAYGYPFITAIDLLTNIRLYLSDNFTEDMMGRLAAQLLVLRTGTVFGLGLAMICAYSWWNGRSHARAMVFSAVLSVFLFLITKSFEIVYDGFSATAVIHTFVLLPGSTGTRIIKEPLGKIAS
jgi:hypothetical protein